MRKITFFARLNDKKKINKLFGLRTKENERIDIKLKLKLKRLKFLLLRPRFLYFENV